MKRIFLIAILITGFSNWCYNQYFPAGKAVADIDVAAAVALAKEIPLLSLNLNNYKHPSNPVLVAGEKGQWDDGGIERVVVIRVAADDWRLWYACSGSKPHSIGLATSKDGVKWTKYLGNPVLIPNDPWEKNYFSPSSVIRVNGKFYLYYWAPGHVFPDKVTGKLPPPYMKYICLAISEDGINWTRTGEVDGLKGAVLGPNPPGLNEDKASGGSGVDAAKVFYLPEEKTFPFKMIYTAFALHGQWNGIAESNDGINWTKTRAPIANHSGFYTGATGNHHNSGQTIRCPVRIGSVWAGLSFELDSRDCAPMVGLELDNWVTLGQRTFYGNQDNEGTGLHPWTMEADNEWFYIYYGMGKSGTGLIKAPKRSFYQPLLMWDSQKIEADGAFSKILEPDIMTYTLHLESDKDGKLDLVAWNPVTKKWTELGALPVKGGKLFSIDPLPNHAKLRLKFTPAEGQAVVSSWAVPQK